MIPRYISALDPGTVFIAAGMKLKLIMVNQCRARVKIMSDTARAITRRTSDGEETLAEFTTGGQEINISPTTEITEVLMTEAEAEWAAPEETPMPRSRAKGERGKPAAEKMLKMLKPDKKIGRVAAYLLEGKKPVDDVAKKFDITHACALSYLFVLHRDYGIGHKVVDDSVTLILPAGTKNPFNAPPPDELTIDDEVDPFS